MRSSPIPTYKVLITLVKAWKLLSVMHPLSSSISQAYDNFKNVVSFKEASHTGVHHSAFAIFSYHYIEWKILTESHFLNYC